MTKKMPRPMTTLPPHRVKVNTVPIGTGRCFPQDPPIATIAWRGVAEQRS